ncbi:MAG: ribonuclease H-like domain-containing protein [Anaerolineales bacterium]
MKYEKKLAAFDLEIAKLIPADGWDLKSVSPLGISCAALALSGQTAPLSWYGIPQLTQEECQKLVRDLERIVRDGYTIITWNGCKFDFQVLAQESGMVRECARLARDHVDLMLMVTFEKGWLLSLQKALEGAGLKGKLKKVELKSGKVIYNMDGAMAPQQWAQGEVKAVLDYLFEDVKQLLELAAVVEKDGCISWTSSSGKPQSVEINRFKTVQECLQINEPDVSWMRNPPRRSDFIGWAQPYWLEI